MTPIKQGITRRNLGDVGGSYKMLPRWLRDSGTDAHSSLPHAIETKAAVDARKKVGVEEPLVNKGACTAIWRLLPAIHGTESHRLISSRHPRITEHHEQRGDACRYAPLPNESVLITAHSARVPSCHRGSRQGESPCQLSVCSSRPCWYQQTAGETTSWGARGRGCREASLRSDGQSIQDLDFGG